MLAPPIARTGAPNIPPSIRRARRVLKFGASAVGTCRATKTASVTRYIGFRPKRMASDKGDHIMTPRPNHSITSAFLLEIELRQRLPKRFVFRHAP